MAYITAELLQNFMHKFPDDVTLVGRYAAAAEETVAAYIGYSPELCGYVTERYGDGGALFELDAMPLVRITEATEDGAEIPPDTLGVRSRNYLERGRGRGTFFFGKLYKIAYSAGFARVPDRIVNVALQVASLIWESEGGNIAVSSTSFGDNGGRVFNNFKADRFLSDLDGYRLGRGGQI